MRLISGFAWLFLFSPSLLAQTGGQGVFSSGNLETQARKSALGGAMITTLESELSPAIGNPAFLHRGNRKQANLTAVKYFSGISFGELAYGFGKKTNHMAGFRYLNFGTAPETNELGEETGRSVSGLEFMGYYGWGESLKTLRKKGSRIGLDTLLRIGFKANFMYSRIADFYALGIWAEGGLAYYSSKSGLGIGLTIGSAGYQLKPYRKNNRENIRPVSSLGFSKKFKKAPLRVFATYHHLEKWKLKETESEIIQTGVQGDEGPKKSNYFFDNLSRHFIFGIEFIPVKNFYLRLGYHTNRRRELQVSTRKYISGFSWGFGFRVSKFHVSYANAVFSAAGAANQITIGLNTGEFYSRKRTYMVEPEK